MNIGTFLTTATKTLQAAAIDTARLDCLVLLEDELGQDRASILAHPEAKMDKTTEVSLNKKIIQRSHHIPLAYIRGKAEFYGREFKVNPAVLVPRPETEDLIDLAKNLSLPARPKILDLGCGSGCIGITLALEIPETSVKLSDVDQKTLDVARQNADLHKTRVTIRKNDLLGDGGDFDLVVANLPYVPEDFPINQAAAHEPKTALFGGPDGLDLYRRLFAQLKKHKTAHIITESLPTQHKALEKIAGGSNYTLKATKHFAQYFSW